MQELISGLRGSGYLNESQSDKLAKFVDAWLKSEFRQFQILSQNYYDGKQEILGKKHVFKNKQGKEEKYPDTVPNERIVDNIYQRIVDQKATFVSDRKLKFIALPSHPIDFNDPSSIDTDTVGDIDPTGGYGVGDVDGVPLIKTDDDAERKREKGFLSALDKLFNEDWRSDLDDALKFCLIDGQCWLFPYTDDEDGEFRIRVFRGRDILPIYTDERMTKLAAIVRWYEVQGLDVKQPKDEYIEVYRKENMIRYKLKRNTGGIHQNAMMANEWISRNISSSGQSGVRSGDASQSSGSQTSPQNVWVSLTDGVISNYIRYDNAAEAPSPDHMTYSWGEIPFIPLISSRPPRPLLARCKTIQDDLNETTSNWSRCQNTYPDKGVLIVVNAAGTEQGELWEKIAQDRCIMIKSSTDRPGGDVKFLEVPMNGEEYERYTNMAIERMYRNTSTFNDSSPSVLQSHMQETTLRAAMQTMERDGNVQKRSYERAINRLIKNYFIPYLVMKGFPDYSDIAIGIRFGEAGLRNNTELLNQCATMGLRLSQRTLREYCPIVDDADEEQERSDQDQNKEMLRMMEMEKFKVELQANIEKERMKIQQEAREKEMKQMTAQNVGGFGDGSGNAANPGGEKRLGINQGAGTELSTGSTKGGGKAADLPRAVERKAEKDKDPTSKVQPPR